MLTTIYCVIVLIVELILLPKKIIKYKKSKADLDSMGIWSDIIIIICMVLLLIDAIFF